MQQQHLPGVGTLVDQPAVLEADTQFRARTKALKNRPFELSGLCRIKEIERLVQTVVASWSLSCSVAEARRWQRAAYARPLAITPLDDDTERPVGETMIARGHDISRCGISFVHLDPLPCRKVAITFLSDEAPGESLVTRLKWCRFTRKGVYESGGHFLRTIDLTMSSEQVKTLRRA